MRAKRLQANLLLKLLAFGLALISAFLICFQLGPSLQYYFHYGTSFYATSEFHDMTEDYQDAAASAALFQLISDGEFTGLTLTDEGNAYLESCISDLEDNWPEFCYRLYLGLLDYDEAADTAGEAATQKPDPTSNNAGRNYAYGDLLYTVGSAQRDIVSSSAVWYSLSDFASDWLHELYFYAEYVAFSDDLLDRFATDMGYDLCYWAGYDFCLGDSNDGAMVEVSPNEVLFWYLQQSDIGADLPGSGEITIVLTVGQPVTGSLLWTSARYYAAVARPLLEWDPVVICGILLLISTLWLLWTCGHKQGVVGIHRSWLAKVPFDLYLALWLIAAAVVADICLRVLRWTLNVTVGEGIWYFSVAGTLAVFTVLALLVPLTIHLKAHTLWNSCLLIRLFRWCRGLLASMRAFWQLSLGTAAYLVVLAVSAWNGGEEWWYGGPSLWWCFMLVWLAAGILLVAWWARGLKRLQQGIDTIYSGDLKTKIDTGQMSPDLRTSAEKLNDLSSVVENAAEEKYRSDRFQAELITNVSHDLKTPLTSIINYVDLLKKLDIQDETAREYIQVLERKSLRLKQLTEDLVEASKASTGVLPVELIRLDLKQLAVQALAEYQERLENAGLTPVLDAPEGELPVLGDSRHLWRILDNLLGNCVKYAMPGTRVYLTLTRNDAAVVLEVKNISRQQLNVPAEKLMERFARGDASRTTEGSGLGLSIAGSLAQIQNMDFRLAIDGDLFKAVLTCRLEQYTPSAEPPAPPATAEEQVEELVRELENELTGERDPL